MHRISVTLSSISSCQDAYAEAASTAPQHESQYSLDDVIRAKS